MKAQTKTTIESLRFELLDFAYDTSLPVFKQTTFDFPTSAVTLVEGDTRQGRSSLLRILAGLSLPTGGKYLLNGQDVGKMSFKEFLPYRKLIGFSFDYGGLIANRTIWKNLMLPLEYHRSMEPTEASEKVAALCRAFGLFESKDSYPAAVSGGARKACTVARAFVTDPELLLLDDPFVALDDRAAEAVVETVRNARKSGSIKHVLFTGKNDRWAERLGCDCTVRVEERTIRGPTSVHNPRLKTRVAG